MIPGSALRKLSAITGLVARKRAEACYSLDINPDCALFSFVKDEKEACKSLRDINWKRICFLKFESQEWKCAECSGVKPLQGHHVIYKSRWRRQDGPLDVDYNIRGLCSDCHGNIHRPAAL